MTLLTYGKPAFVPGRGMYAPPSVNGYPRLVPASVATDTAIGGIIGTLTATYPRLTPSTTPLDAAIGSVIGTIRI